MNRFVVALALLTVACKAAIPAAPPASPPPSASDVDVSGDKAPGFPDAIVEVDNCDLTGSRVFGELSGTIVRCPTDCASPAVYGGGVYDMSSSFCTALRHAGAISADRPLAYVEQVPAPRAMRGGEANGVRAGTTEAVSSRSCPTASRPTGASPSRGPKRPTRTRRG